MRTSLILLAALTSGPLFATTTLVNENFDSATLGSNMGWTVQGSNLWAVSTDSALDGSGQVFKNTATSQQNVGVSYASTVLGTVGDYIQVSMSYRYSAAPTGGNAPFNFLRMGLYNDGGSPSTYIGDAGYLGDVGYWTTATAPTKTGDFAVRVEQNVYEDYTNGVLLENTSATVVTPPGPPAFGDIVTMANVARVSEGVDGTSVHTAKLVLTKTSTGIQSELFWDNTSKVSAIDTASTVTSFNTLYFEAPWDNTGGGEFFAIDNLVVETNVAPEPSRMLLVALGAVGLIARRRRVRA